MSQTGRENDGPGGPSTRKRQRALTSLGRAPVPYRNALSFARWGRLLFTSQVILYITLLTAVHSPLKIFAKR